MNIDLGEEIIFKVALGDKTYELREPSVLEMSAFKTKIDASEDTGLAEMVNLLVVIGMPKKVVENLGIQKMNKLVEGILGGVTEKK